MHFYNKLNSFFFAANTHVLSIKGAITGLPINFKHYAIYTKNPNKDPEAYYTEILNSTLGRYV